MANYPGIIRGKHKAYMNCVGTYICHSRTRTEDVGLLQCIETSCAHENTDDTLESCKS